jgi:hypothetical protein
VFTLLLQCGEPIQVGPRTRRTFGPGQRLQSLRAPRDTYHLAKPGIRVAAALRSQEGEPVLQELLPVRQRSGGDLDQVIQHGAGAGEPRPNLPHLFEQGLWALVKRLGLVNGAQVAGAGFTGVYIGQVGGAYAASIVILGIQQLE